MSIVFILLGALAATLFLVSKLGLDLPPQASADIEGFNTRGTSREDFRIAA